MARRRPLPRAVQIGSVRYAVSRDADRLDEATAEGVLPYNAGAAIFPVLGEILLRPACPSFEQDSLLHEIIHGCLNASGCFPDELKAGRNGLSVEEQIVSAITGPLLRVLQEHPDLVRFLSSRVDTDA